MRGYHFRKWQTLQQFITPVPFICTIYIHLSPPLKTMYLVMTYKQSARFNKSNQTNVHKWPVNLTPRKIPPRVPYLSPNPELMGLLRVY